VEKPGEAAVAPDGSVVFVDLNRVWRLTPSGSLRLIGGHLESGFGGDGGPATAAYLDSPTGIDVEPDGSILIADTYNHRVRLIDRAGIIRTIAGDGQEGYAGDGAQATQAQLGEPLDVKRGPDGYIYIADSNNTVVRRVSPSGTISTYLGTGNASANAPSTDGTPALQYNLQDPLSLAFDIDGRLLVLDFNTVIRVNTDLTVVAIAGNGQTGKCQDSLDDATQGTFNSAISISVDHAGGILVADPGCNEIRYVTPAGALQPLIGTGQPGMSPPSGAVSNAQLHGPLDAVPAPDGSVIVLDSGNDRVLRVRDGKVSTLYQFRPSSIAGVY
jgi:sugar lactone lactonase YvrE